MGGSPPSQRGRDRARFRARGRVITRDSQVPRAHSAGLRRLSSCPLLSTPPPDPPFTTQPLPFPYSPHALPHRVRSCPGAPKMHTICMAHLRPGTGLDLGIQPSASYFWKHRKGPSPALALPQLAPRRPSWGVPKPPLRPGTACGQGSTMARTACIQPVASMRTACSQHVYSL